MGLNHDANEPKTGTAKEVLASFSHSEYIKPCDVWIITEEETETLKWGGWGWLKKSEGMHPQEDFHNNILYTPNLIHHVWQIVSAATTAKTLHYTSQTVHVICTIFGGLHKWGSRSPSALPVFPPME